MRSTKVIGLAMATAVVLLAVGAACTDSSSAPTATETPSLGITNVRVTTPTPAPSPTPGQYVPDASRGEATFSQQCTACHGSGGAGGVAPALNTADFAQEFATDEAVVAIVRAGLGGMPAYGTNRLSDEAVADLVAYMRSLLPGAPLPPETGGHAPAPTLTPSPTATGSGSSTSTPEPSPVVGQSTPDASRGEAVYSQRCTACHGSGGAGGFAPALNTADFAQEFASDEAVVAIVRDGRGGMPAYDPGTLADQEVADLVAYMRSLQ